MAHARSRGGSRRRLKRKYSWHGFYQPTLLPITTQSNHVFALYDPIDADHPEQSTLVRIRGWYTVISSETAINGNIGMGIYYGQRNSSGGLTTDIDPAGNSGFDIESNSTLWLRQMVFGDTDLTNATKRIDGEWDIKAKRKVEDPATIVIVIRADQSNDFEVAFNCRCLMDDGV